MLKNYLKIAWRNLLKKKGYTLINISGVGIGMACCLLIALYVKNELSYDQYHKNVDKIYRVLHSDQYGENPKESSSLTGADYYVWGNAPVGQALKKDFPEIEEVVQFSGRAGILLKHGEQTFQEDDVIFADATVFDVFSWKLLSGDPQNALETPYSIVLTESAARKYFGDENPIGQTIEGGQSAGRSEAGIYTVTGVMEDVPANSHFAFEALLSMSTFRKARPGVFDTWEYNDFFTYFMVQDQSDIGKLIEKIPEFLKQNYPLEKSAYFISFEPLSNAYLKSDALRQPGITGSVTSIYIFSFVGIFILIIACVNFINLATARSVDRAKEVGVRKTAGVNTNGLVFQFLSESLLLSFLAAGFALILMIGALPFVPELTGKEFNLDDLISWRLLPFYIGITVLIGMLSGFYPALVLSRFRPITVLKGAFRSSSRGVFLRKSLVVFQFSLSIALIAGTAVVFLQLKYLHEKDLGFQQEQMLVIDFDYDEAVRNQIETIKQSFLELPEVISASASRSIPGSEHPDASAYIESPQGEMTLQSPFLYQIDHDFIKHFGIEVVAGRGFSRSFLNDMENSLVVNEAAAKLYGYSDVKEIVGKRFSQWGREGQVIGVVKDFNYLSLHDNPAPLTLRLDPNICRYLTLHIKSGNLPHTIEKIEQLWETVVPDRPFLYSFLDDSFDKQYQADFRFRKLFTLFSFLGILIACFGLLGLSTYMTEQRTKEIGIRKVLGANISSIVSLLSKNFIVLVLVAILIATPISWYAMNYWLEGFAYRIAMQWWMFGLAGLLAVMLAMLTISFQSVKAALTNPAKSLRTE